MVFSHQKRIIESLSPYFSSTTVISREKDSGLDGDGGLRILTWKRGSPLFSVLRLYVITFTSILKRTDVRVLFLQTDFEAALLSPILFCAKIKCVVWYAHGHTSAYLKIASRFVNTIISANSESCKLQTSKVKVIGHMIDSDLFPPSSIDSIHENLTSFFHLGRGDISKRIDLVTEVVGAVCTKKSPVSLTLIGKPSNKESQLVLDRSLDKLKYSSPELKIFHRGWIIRDELARELSQKGIFIHAFQGSLDKAILESTLNLNPVATLNKGYIREFGRWSQKTTNSDKSFLLSEIDAILSLSKKELERELSRRREIVLNSHSLSHWVVEVLGIII